MTESIRQRIALAEFLGSRFLKVRADKLNDEALAEMTVGERLACTFGGQVAAWLSLPKPAQRAAVTNKELFTAWVKEHLPAEIETVEIVRPGTQASLLAAAKANGGKWLDKETGEYVVIDGITTGVSDPSPRVELTDDAAEVIGAAWRAGTIDLTPLLALDPPLSDEPGTATDTQVGKIVTVCQSRFGFKRAEREQMVRAAGGLIGYPDLGGFHALSEAEAVRLLDALDGIAGRDQLDGLHVPPAAEDVAA